MTKIGPVRAPGERLVKGNPRSLGMGRKHRILARCGRGAATLGATGAVLGLRECAALHGRMGVKTRCPRHGALPGGAVEPIGLERVGTAISSLASNCCHPVLRHPITSVGARRTAPKRASMTLCSPDMRPCAPNGGGAHGGARLVPSCSRLTTGLYNRGQGCTLWRPVQGSRKR
jgi:hypothetical protein